MKQFLLYISFIGSLLLWGCDDSKDNIMYPQNTCLSFSVGVNDYSQYGSTRSSYSVVTSGANNAVDGINASFEDGDAFGLYIVDSSGKVIHANVKCQLIDGKWVLQDEPICYVKGMANYDFYAYYPYHENISGGRVINSSVSSSISADDFFSGIIDSWSPASDQSTQESFGGSDLMVTKGTTSMPYYQNVTLSFTFNHKMGMVVTKKNRYYHITDDTYSFDGISKFSGNMPYLVDGWYLYIVKPDVTTSLGGHDYKLASGEYLQDVANIDKYYVDLSMVDNAGNARTLGRSTANCYMVHSDGYYKFPLVYGNAIRNGLTNSSAYHTDVVDSNVRQTLVNHNDDEITDPWLKNNGVTVDGVELLWQDQPEMITEVAVDGDYITFDVTGWQQGNAVISAKSGSTIVWSWHIWLTDETFADSDLTTIDTGDQTYDVTPVNIGWVKPTNKQLAGRYYGHCTFYQWGRPIAMPGTNGSVDKVHPVYGTSGNTALTASNYPEYSNTDVSIGTTIRTPTKHYCSPNTYTPYNESNINYWDINQFSFDNITTHTVKTVYDPCPPDFCVPTSNLCYYIGNKIHSPDYGYWDDDKKGRYWLNNGIETGLFFPATGYRKFNDIGFIGVRSNGNYWSSSPHSGSYMQARTLGVYSNTWSWDSKLYTYGLAVRSVKEIY